MKHKFRFYYPGPLQTDFIDLKENEHHHLANILRLKSGDIVEAFDGKGTHVSALINSVNKNYTRLIINSIFFTPKPDTQITLGIGCLASQQMSELIPSLVELGVDEIHCFLQRGLPKSRIITKNLERWQRVSVEACKQSKRTWIPRIQSYGSTRSYFSETVKNNHAVICDTKSINSPFDFKKDISNNLFILVGSEIGFDNGEISLAKSLGYFNCSLGENVLRAPTAALAATAIFTQIQKNM